MPLCRASVSKSSGLLDVLGFPVGLFCPFSFWVPLLKPNSRENGTLIFLRGYWETHCCYNSSIRATLTVVGLRV